MKIVTVVGARPQFIKAAVVSRALLGQAQEVLVHTGQHYDPNMSQVFFDQLEIPTPAYHLGVGSGPHGQQTGRMLEGIERVLLQEQPDWVLVYGDTNSTLAGALAAVKLHIPVAHVEAGLRSFNRKMPEEINRVLTDHAAHLLLAPTQAAVNNLANEGIAGAKVHFVGDVMYDAALFYGQKAQTHSQVLQGLGLAPKSYALATVHRAENTNDPQRLQSIVQAFIVIAQQQRLVWPVHPRTRAVLQSMGLLAALEEWVTLVEPVGYLDMAMLEKNASLILTDSGGVQKEAFFYRVPCLTLRSETEWVELVQLGWVRLVEPSDAAAIVQAALSSFEAREPQGSPYGNGDAGINIVQHLN